METAYLTALSAVAGAAIGATASLGTTWLTQRYQDRSQRLAQERARRERLFSEFIDQASQLYADALSHTALEDPARLVPLYATIGKLRLFASERTIAAADAVMVRIVEAYYLPNVDFTSRPSPPAGDSDMLRDFDLLRDFTEACRAELGG
jgi:hypothetical protein